jgi:hypothetical protein
MKVNVKVGFGADLELTIPDVMSVFDLKKGLGFAENYLKTGLETALIAGIKQLSAIGITAKVIRSGVKIEEDVKKAG